MEEARFHGSSRLTNRELPTAWSSSAVLLNYSHPMVVALRISNYRQNVYLHFTCANEGGVSILHMLNPEMKTPENFFAVLLSYRMKNNQLKKINSIPTKRYDLI